MVAAVFKITLHLATTSQVIVDDGGILGVKLILGAFLQNALCLEQSLMPDLQVTRTIFLKGIDLFYRLLIETGQQCQQLLSLLLLPGRASLGLFYC